MSISFCFPTYNRFVHIKKAIESVRNGIGRYSYEIIIADGGSTDGTIEYLKNQKDVILIEQNKLTGGVKAYNECFKKIKYEYVFWPSDDFIIQIDTILKSCYLMDKYPEIGAISPKFIELKNIASRKANYPNVDNWNGIIVSKTHVFRTSALIEINFFDEYYRSYYVDIDSHLAVLCLGYVTLFTKECGSIHTRQEDATRNNNIQTADKSEKEFNHFKSKYKGIEKKLISTLSFMEKVQKNIFFRFSYFLLKNKLMQFFMNKKNSFAINLYDWALESSAVYKCKKFDKFKGYYLAQKLPDSVVAHYRERIK